MNFPTLKQILEKDRWIKIVVDRDLLNSHLGVYSPNEGRVYLSQAQADLFFDAPDYMETRIQVVDLSEKPERVMA